MIGFLVGEIVDFVLVFVLAPVGLGIDRHIYWRDVRAAEEAFVPGDAGSLVVLLRAVQPYGPPYDPGDDFYDRLGSCLAEAHFASAVRAAEVRSQIESCAERVTQSDPLRYVPKRSALLHLSRFLAKGSVA